MEFDNRYASNGKGNVALATGIIGTALGVLNGGLAGWNGGNCNRAGYGWNGYGGCGECSENSLVTRYELQQEQTIASKDSEIALLKANTYGDQKLLEVYKYFDGELKAVRETLSAQAVYNQRTADSFELVRKDIEMEAKQRCCGDNSIVTYANATFYPKMVADVTTGTATTAQTLYNPIPNCSSSCCNGNN